MMRDAMVTVIVWMALAAGAQAQSSSLYVQPTPPVQRDHGRIVTPVLERMSFTAVAAPQPRQFARHDLITIIIRESSTASLEAELETEKQASVNGGINAFPKLDLRDLIHGQLNNGDPSTPIQLDVNFSNDFEGDGEYERRDTLTTRLTARVIDVKPNGTLALEARTHIQNDDETLTITLTGYCRADDVAVDNTVLSTQMFDLRVRKMHEGELRKSTKKGLLSKVLETIFNF